MQTRERPNTGRGERRKEKYDEGVKAALAKMWNLLAILMVRG